MRKQYTDPQVFVFTAEEKENILLVSDVDIDVEPLYGSDIDDLLN